MPIKTVLICDYCGTPIADGDGKFYPTRIAIHSGLSVDLGCGTDGQRLGSYRHHDCQREHWLHNVTGALALDKPMNDCRFFVRDGSTEYGWYEREGQRYPERLWATIDDGMVQAGGNTGEPFCSWLKERGWLENWFEPRKPEEYPRTVWNRRTGRDWYASVTSNST